MILLLTPTAFADWYRGGTVYHDPNYWAYCTAERYVGEQYITDFADMAERTQKAAESGTEYPTPSVFRFAAESVTDAEAKLEKALEYAPQTITIEFTDTETAKAMHDKYANWRENGTQIDLIVSTAWTRQDGLVGVARHGKSVCMTINRYADGWLAYVDTSDAIRVYKSVAYSRMLKEYRQRFDGISGTDVEKIIAVANAVIRDAKYDYAERDYVNLNHSVGRVDSHSVRGVVDGKLAVCDGFSAAMQFGCACVGVKAFETIIEGNGFGNHSFNKVRCDGVWCNIDVTQMLTHPIKPSKYVGFPDVRYEDYNWLSWVQTIYKCV